MTPFGQEAAFQLEVEVLAPQALDPVSMGPVRVVSITGGRVLGRLEGTILPGGTDWQTVEADGSVGIEARYLLELTDGARIELQSRGRRGAGAGRLLVQHLAAHCGPGPRLGQCRAVHRPGAKARRPCRHRRFRPAGELISRASAAGPAGCGSWMRAPKTASRRPG